MIQLFAAGFAPTGWILCDGATYQIEQLQYLYVVIGNRFGGDPDKGEFKVPDLRGVTVVGSGNGYVFGDVGGNETIVLDPSHLAAHTHNATSAFQMMGTNAPANTSDPTGTFPAVTADDRYAPLPKIPQQMAAINDSGITNTAGNDIPEKINMMMPYMPLTYMISFMGIYPARKS